MKATLRLALFGILVLVSSNSWAQSNVLIPQEESRFRWGKGMVIESPRAESRRSQVDRMDSARPLSTINRGVHGASAALPPQPAPEPVAAQTLYQTSQLPTGWDNGASASGIPTPAEISEPIDWGFPNAIPGEPAHFYKPASSNWAMEYGIGTWNDVNDGPRIDFQYFDGLGCDDWACFCNCRVPLPLNCHYLFAGRGNFDPNCGLYRGKHGCGKHGCGTHGCGKHGRGCGHAGCESCGGYAGKYPPCNDGSCLANHSHGHRKHGCRNCHGTEGCDQCQPAGTSAEFDGDPWQRQVESEGLLKSRAFRNLWR